MRRDTEVATKRDRKSNANVRPDPANAAYGVLGRRHRQQRGAVDDRSSMLAAPCPACRCRRARIATSSPWCASILTIRLARLSRGLEGWVQVQFTITPTGTVEEAVVVNAEPKNIFDDAALKAIARWRYNPKVEGGVAVERVGVQTIIRFQLEQ